jgi:hypothetical protein
MIARLAMAAALLIPITTSSVIAKEMQYHVTSAAVHSDALRGSVRADATRHAAPSFSQAVYGYDGRYLGTDPDPFIRLQLLREGSTGSY